MKNKEFLLDILKKCSDIAYEILNAVNWHWMNFQIQNSDLILGNHPHNNFLHNA